MVTWSVWAGSAAGTAHLRHSRDCDDAYATAHSAGALLLAVADGASGARFGAIGARMAVALAIREAGALPGAFGSADLDRPAHAIPNATPYLFDAETLARAAAGVELAVGPSG